MAIEAPISVIVPAYREKRIEETLLSLQAQTCNADEVLIVVDGETEPFETNYRVIEIPHSGAAAARNVGFDVSSCPYVLFLDADTILYPTYLEVMMDAVQKYPFAYCDYLRCGELGGVQRGQPFDTEALKDENYIDTGSLVRRDILPDPPFDIQVKRFQDWDLWLTVTSQGHQGTYVPEVLMSKYYGPQDISLSVDQEEWEERVRQKHHLPCNVSC